MSAVLDTYKQNICVLVFGSECPKYESFCSLWILCFGSEEVKEAKDLRGFDASGGEAKNQEPSEYLRDLAAAARSRLEIKIKNSLLLVDPPIENARATWINQLSTTMDIIVAMPRIKHTAYSEFSVGECQFQCPHSHTNHVFPSRAKYAENEATFSAS